MDARIEQVTVPIMEIRKYKAGEAADLWEIFFGAIRYVCCRDYSDAQVKAWAPDDFDQKKWESRVESLNPYVVLVDKEIAGYADLQDDGLIDHFFVGHKFQRQGVGNALMTSIIAEARLKKMPRLYSYVSDTAKDFYCRYGFAVVKLNTETVRGVELTNNLMEQVLE